MNENCHSGDTRRRETESTGVCACARLCVYACGGDKSEDVCSFCHHKRWFHESVFPAPRISASQGESYPYSHPDGRPSPEHARYPPTLHTRQRLLKMESHQHAQSQRTRHPSRVQRSERCQRPRHKDNWTRTFLGGGHLNYAWVVPMIIVHDSDGSLREGRGWQSDC